MSITVMSLNVRVWTRDRSKSSEHWWIKRYKAIHEYIKEQAPDIICLQEVWWPAKYVLRLGALGYKKTGWGFSHPIFVRKNLKVSKRRVSLFSTMAIVGDIQVFSVHCRWEEKLFQRAMMWIRKNQIRHYWSKPCIVCGDFNRSNISSIYDATNHMRSARNFLNVSRKDTFANYKRPTQSHGELDHIFFMPIYGFKPLTYTIGPSDLSDHRPVVVAFQNKAV